MSSDPYAPRRVCVTIKVPESKRYAADNPWLVFEGDVEGVKEMIAAAFGLDPTGLSLHSVTLNAQNIATSTGHALQGLGASVLSEGSANKPASAPAESGGDVWSQAQGGQSGPPWPTEEKKDEPKVDPVLAAIEGCQSVSELQQVWAENQDAFNANPSYMDSYKAKGRALTAG